LGARKGRERGRIRRWGGVVGWGVGEGGELRGKGKRRLKEGEGGGGF